MLSSDVWWLSVAYIGPKSRTVRPRKTKIDTEVAHVTRDSNTTFKVKRSRSPGRFIHRGVYTSSSCSGGHGNVLAVRTYCYVSVRRDRLGGASALSAPTEGGEGRGHIVAAPAQLVFSTSSKILLAGRNWNCEVERPTDNRSIARRRTCYKLYYTFNRFSFLLLIL